MNEKEKLDLVKKTVNEGYAAQQAGDLKSASRLYKKALRIVPGFMIALNNLANVYNATGEFQKAYKILKKVLKIDSEYIHANFNMGYSLLKLNRPLEVIPYLKKVINKNEYYTDAYLILGLCYSYVEEYKNAIEVYKEALRLWPNNEAILNNMGNAYRDMGEVVKAEQVFKKVIDINPNFAFAYTSLSVLYGELEKYELAIRYATKAIKLNSNNYLGYLSIGQWNFARQRYMDGISNLNAALSYKPKDYKATTLLYEGYANLCDWEMCEVISRKPEFIESVQSWLSIVSTDNPKKNLLAAKLDATDIENKTGRKFTKYPKKSHTKIRIGYLSGDFRDHPVGHLTHNMFKYHDRSKFEIFVFSYGKDDKTTYRDDVIKGCDKFIDVYGLPALKIAQIIYEGQIDILIDLMGNTYQAKPEIMAARPAPIQIQFLGYPGTSGSNFIDYIVGDKIVIPKKDEKYYTEKILRLPNSFMVVDDEISIRKNVFEKKYFGLPEDKIILSSFSAPIKIDKKTFDLWLEVLKKLPESVLWLRDSSIYAQDNLKREAQVKGVNPERLIFSKRLVDKNLHLSRLTLVDIALDSLIYGGHTTTVDFLLAGVPVITIDGKHFASKVAASILTAAGLSECVAKDEKDYLNTVVRLGKNKNKLKLLKKKIIDARKKKAFFSTKTYVGNFEKGLSKIWTNYQRGNKPKNIEVG